MATGYRYRTEADSGIRISSAAGSLIAVLDDLLTSGGSPWSKTVNGTNDATYTAPGGSQIKLRVYNNVAHTTSFIVRVTGQVGSGAVFPSSTQEANAGQGSCVIRVRRNSSALAANDARYIGIRTDRFMLLCVTQSDTAFIGSVLIAGDIPTVFGADPGLCVVMSTTTNSLTSTSSSTGVNAGFMQANSTTGGTVQVEYGYAELAPNGTTTPVPIGPKFAVRDGSNGPSVTNSFGKIILGEVYVWSALTTTATTASGAFTRGKIPYIRSIENSSGIAFDDTFSEGAANFIVKTDDSNTSFFAIMTNDQETGLP